jgi:hypothetical protein
MRSGEYSFCESFRFMETTKKKTISRTETRGDGLENIERMLYRIRDNSIALCRFWSLAQGVSDASSSKTLLSLKWGILL